jgi:frataxin
MLGPPLLLQFLALARDGQPFSPAACSDLSMERYHALSDATMTTILERLEEFLDEVGNDAYEVDYHVSMLKSTTSPYPSRSGGLCS